MAVPIVRDVDLEIRRGATSYVASCWTGRAGNVACTVTAETEEREPGGTFGDPVVSDASASGGYHRVDLTPLVAGKMYRFRLVAAPDAVPGDTNTTQWQSFTVPG